MNDTETLAPLLVVRGARQAIDFYVRALGARVLACREYGEERRIGHAELALGSARFAVTEELTAWNSDAPPSLGGSPVVLQLGTLDVQARVESLIAAGARVVFPLQELEGEQMARVRDPFGHLWIVRQPPKDTANIAPPPGAPQAPNAPRLHLVLGPVGAGKSTFAAGLAREQGAVRLTLDEWMVTLFSPDRPESGALEWYAERAQRSIEQIWKLTTQLAALGSDVVLELGLLRQCERERFFARVVEAGLALTLYVLDAAREVRRARVLERNQARGATFSMLVPLAIFELASDLWQPPDAAECEGRDVRFLRTDV